MDVMFGSCIALVGVLLPFPANSSLNLDKRARYIVEAMSPVMTDTVLAWRSLVCCDDDREDDDEDYCDNDGDGDDDEVDEGTVSIKPSFGAQDIQHNETGDIELHISSKTTLIKRHWHRLLLVVHITLLWRRIGRDARKKGFTRYTWRHSALGTLSHKYLRSQLLMYMQTRVDKFSGEIGAARHSSRAIYLARFDGFNHAMAYMLVLLSTIDNILHNMRGNRSNPLGDGKILKWYMLIPDFRYAERWGSCAERSAELGGDVEVVDQSIEAAAQELFRILLCPIADCSAVGVCISHCFGHSRLTYRKTPDGESRGETRVYFS